MTAIEFENISKQYRLGLVSTRTLSHDLHRWWVTNVLRKDDPYLKVGEVNDRAHKGKSEYVWALKDINLKVEQGDVLGIIGKNGAGKSTLLKLLSKVTAPTTGEIRARGRIASLLEVGTGFHQEMTGRENIYMNGAIMGMTKTEINRKLDEIVDFSGCERYLDTPVKRYSSGMVVRLGFAVAAHLDPEILVVDEVLAVGDAEFQKKAIGKMQDVSRSDGRTVLFVSHNMASIKQLCRHGVVLKDGRMDFSGEINSVVEHYLKDNSFTEHKIIDTVKVHTSILKVLAFKINGSEFNEMSLANDQMSINISIECELSSASRLEPEAMLYDENQILLASFCPGHAAGEYEMLRPGVHTIEKTISFPANMTKGSYYLNVFLSDPNVAYLMSLSAPVKLDVEGCLGESGMSFLYKDRGLLMLE